MGHTSAVRAVFPDVGWRQATEMAEKIAPNDSEDDAYADGGAGVSRVTPKDKEREARAPRFPTAGFRRVSGSITRAGHDEI